DSLAHQRSLVSFSCTPGTCTNPQDLSFTLPGTRLTHRCYRHSSTHHPLPCFGLLRLALLPVLCVCVHG
ncbi:hypothetical protein C0993_009656, partial [Termitomyces sp. T159_Od127]